MSTETLLSDQNFHTLMVKEKNKETQQLSITPLNLIQTSYFPLCIGKGTVHNHKLTKAKKYPNNSILSLVLFSVCNTQEHLRWKCCFSFSGKARSHTNIFVSHFLCVDRSKRTTHCRLL